MRNRSILIDAGVDIHRGCWLQEIPVEDLDTSGSLRMCVVSCYGRAPCRMWVETRIYGGDEEKHG